MIAIANFGEKLRTEREKQGYTLAQVSQETKIRKYYLSALEEDDFESLPARVYSIGFVASYARFLRLDPDRLVNEFKSLAYIDVPNEPPPIEPKPARILGFPLRNVAAAIVFLVAALWLGSYVAGYITNRAITPPPQAEEPNIPAPAEDPTITDDLTLAITAAQPAWVSVSGDGVVQYTGTMQAGESRSFSAKEKIDLRTGNAGGIELQLNNSSIPPLGAPGQVTNRTFTRADVTGDTAPITSTNPTAAPTDTLSLEVKCLQRSWVQVEADGEPVYAGNMAEGAKETFTAVERIKIRTGNAGGITLILNGQPVEALGTSGQIAEKTFEADGIGMTRRTEP